MAGERKLDGKVAIVTGAGSSGPGVGTGKAISELFAREGAKVVLVDTFEDRAKETLALVEAEGAEAAPPGSGAPGADGVCDLEGRARRSDGRRRRHLREAGTPGRMRT
ncbi:MAG TPA: hypothetical protein VFI47_14720 [Acidimicrobiales bacterium]|nr:hypothetical protein [Acidimicrobiales bacterium]